MLARGEIRLCMDLAVEAMQFADELNDPGILMEALFMLGLTLFYRGGFRERPRLHGRAAGQLR